MRRALLAILALATFGPHASVAAEVEEAIPGLCVSRVVAVDPSKPGIAADALAAAPELGLCDGGHIALVYADGVLGTRLKIALYGGEDPPVCETEMMDQAKISASEGRLYAWLVGSTIDYNHGILGDGIEASGFCIGRAGEDRAFEFMLPLGSVFEDLRVRLVDLTGDGREEFVVVRSYLDRGAALAVYHLVETRISHLAETPAIGIANRWLNPAGAADFDGDGRVEIAYVETPHIGGTLRVWELVDGQLRQEQAVEGFSNHAIGSRELDLSAVLDWNVDGVPDLALPDAARRGLRIVTFADGDFVELDAIPHDAEIVTAILATDLDADGRPELLYGLEDGRLMLARP